MPTDRAARMSRLLGAGVLAVAVAVVLGWYLHVTALQSVAPGLASMKPNTALALGALGLVTVLPPGRRRALVLGGAVSLLGAATLGEYALDRSWGIDLLLPWVDLRGDSPRMAVATATALVALGLGHVLAAQGRGRGRASRVLGLSGFGLGWVGVLGYVYGVSQLYRVGGYTSMALHTALSLTALSIALLLRDPDHGLVAVLRGNGSAGRMMRALAPFVLVVPALLGWLRLRAQDAGLFDTAFGVAVLITTMTVLGLGLTWRVALRLDVADVARDHAAAELRDVNARLEETVSVRTKELEAHRDRLSTLLELAPVAIVELDAQGGLVTVNAQWSALTGLDQEASLGAGWADAIPPEDLPATRARWEDAVRDGRSHESHQRVQRPDGSTRWVQTKTAPLHQDGAVIGHLVTLTDVTDLEQARQEAAAAQQRFERVFTSSPLGAALLAPDATIVAVNDQLVELLESPEEVLLGADLATAFAVDAAASAWLMETLQDPGGVRRTEVMTETLRGHGRCLDLHAVALADAAHGQVVLVKAEDITARRAAERRIEHLALHDALTDLPNRVLLLDRLTQELRQLDRRDAGIGGVGVIFVDLDRFKEVNDELGHDAGDHVLTAVASRLRDAARRSDTVARLGGDEFVVICPGMGDVEALRTVAGTLADAVQEEILYDGRPASVGASIGVAMGTADDEAAALIHAADQAMYRAKRDGRSRVEVFEGDLRTLLPHPRAAARVVEHA